MVSCASIPPTSPCRTSTLDRALSRYRSCASLFSICCLSSRTRLRFAFGWGTAPRAQGLGSGLGLRDRVEGLSRAVLCNTLISQGTCVAETWIDDIGYRPLGAQYEYCNVPVDMHGCTADLWCSFSNFSSTRMPDCAHRRVHKILYALSYTVTERPSHGVRVAMTGAATGTPLRSGSWFGTPLMTAFPNTAEVMIGEPTGACNTGKVTSQRTTKRFSPCGAESR